MLRRFRFAPAPTGMLHVGSLWVYHVNSIMAAACGGDLILRIDDSMERVDAKWLEDFTRLHEYMGMHFSATYFQSERITLHKKFTKSLGNLIDMDGGIGVKVGDNVASYFYDHVRGRRLGRSLNPGYVCLIRRSGLPGYHISSIADDVLLGVTDVVRASDHLDNTALQLWIYPNLSRIKFHHVPLIYTVKNVKISKSSTDPKDNMYLVDSIIRAGVVPDALWAYFNQFMPGMKAKPFQFNMDMLMNHNRRILQGMERCEVMRRVIAYITFTGKKVNLSAVRMYLYSVNFSRFRNLADLVDEAKRLFDACIGVMESFRNRTMSEEDLSLFEVFTSILNVELDGLVNSLKPADKGYIREVLFGLKSSPSLRELILFWKAFMSVNE